MRIISEISLKEFKPWSGAVDTFDIIYKAGMMDDLEAILEELYPDGMTDTELNDLLWFEDDWLYGLLGISEEDDLDEGCYSKKRIKKVNESQYTGEVDFIDVLEDPAGRKVVEILEDIEDDNSPLLMRVTQDLVKELKKEFGYDYVL